MLSPRTPSLTLSSWWRERRQPTLSFCLLFLSVSCRPCVYTAGSPVNNRALFPCQEPPVAMSTWQATVRAAASSVVLMSGENAATPTQVQEGTVHAFGAFRVLHTGRAQGPSAPWFCSFRGLLCDPGWDERPANVLPEKTGAGRGGGVWAWHVRPHPAPRGRSRCPGRGVGGPRGADGYVVHGDPVTAELRAAARLVVVEVSR